MWGACECSVSSVCCIQSAANWATIYWTCTAIANRWVAVGDGRVHGAMAQFDADTALRTKRNLQLEQDQ